MRRFVTQALLTMVSMCALATHVQGQERCLGAANVHGDARVVADLKQEFHQSNSIVNLAPSDCPTTQILIIQNDSGFRVILKDAQGRKTSRQLSSIALSAIWIESRLHQDPLSGAIATPSSKQIPLPKPPSESQQAPNSGQTSQLRQAPNSRLAPDITNSVKHATNTNTSSNTARPTPVTLGQRWVVDGIFLGALDGSDTDWLGGRVGVCRKIGALCIGLSAQHMKASSKTDESISDLYASIEMPLRTNGISINPQFSAGGSRHKWQEETQSNSDTTLRAEVATQLWAPLRSWLSLGIVVNLGVRFAQPQKPGSCDTNAPGSAECDIQVSDAKRFLGFGFGIRMVGN